MINALVWINKILNKDLAFAEKSYDQIKIPLKEN